MYIKTKKGTIVVRTVAIDSQRRIGDLLITIRDSSHNEAPYKENSAINAGNFRLATEEEAGYFTRNPDIRNVSEIISIIKIW